MIVTTEEGRYDTDKDLGPAERHVLQKLCAWESLVTSFDQFRQKREEALRKGWNNTGPVQESAALRAIIRDLEKQVAARLDKRPR